jgi:ribonuclease D
MAIGLSKTLREKAVRRYKADLPDRVLQEARRIGVVGWDIETSGLAWNKDQIATCQIFVPSFDVSLIQFNGSVETPSNLRYLMEDSRVLKIFHHAMFDLRFMAFHWRLRPRNVACTKISSKLLEPLEVDHSLQRTLKKYLNVCIEKESRASDWLKDDLSKQQVNYAVGDVIHLPQLYALLKQRLELCNRWYLATESFEYLPTRVELDILGAGDVFSY